MRSAAATCSWLFLCLFTGNTLAATFNIRDYGAKADRTTNDAPAIQCAIDACSRSGGGEVLVPSGDYLAGKITLKSNVTLKLQAGATIWASARAEDYEPDPKPAGTWFLFVAERQENIAIVGDGRIHGVGREELDRRSDPEREDLRPARRFGIMRFANCKFVRLRDLNIYYSDWHTISLSRCEKVFMDHLAILNNFHRVNSDGIDPISCRDVFISNCSIVAGDDAICPKTENQLPLENLVVQNCVLESVSAAVKLGTGSSGDFRDIKVSHCVIRNSGVGLGIFMKDGGTVERVTFSDISIETTRPEIPLNTRLRNNIIPIYIDIERRDNAPAGRIRDVAFNNIQIDSDNGVLIQGMPERDIENLTLQNLTFRVPRGFDFSRRTKRAGGRAAVADARTTRFVRHPTYFALAHVNGLLLENLRVLIADDAFNQFDRSAVAIFESLNGVIRNVRRSPPGTAGGQPVIAMDNCQQMLVTGCFAPRETPAFLRLSGARTRAVSLSGNELDGVAKPLLVGKEVPAGAVKK